MVLSQKCRHCGEQHDSQIWSVFPGRCGCVRIAFIGKNISQSGESFSRESQLRAGFGSSTSDPDRYSSSHLKREIRDGQNKKAATTCLVFACWFDLRSVHFFFSRRSDDYMWKRANRSREGEGRFALLLLLLLLLSDGSVSMGRLFHTGGYQTPLQSPHPWPLSLLFSFNICPEDSFSLASHQSWLSRYSALPRKRHLLPNSARNMSRHVFRASPTSPPAGPTTLTVLIALRGREPLSFHRVIVHGMSPPVWSIAWKKAATCESS